jgi:hypothetical protein
MEADLKANETGENKASQKKLVSDISGEVFLVLSLLIKHFLVLILRLSSKNV